MTVLALADSRFSVQFGSFVIGSATGCMLSSEYDAEDTSTHGSFYVEFHVTKDAPGVGTIKDDDDALGALVAAAESALRTPRQRLLVKIGSTVVRDWNSAPGVGETQTAILIEPELRLISMNARDYHYGFRVRCQFPGRIPGNTFRRESLTQIETSLRARRTCTIQAEWTSDETHTAYARYGTSGDAFFTAQLPTNLTDQHSTAGTWVLADEDPRYNDENSILTVTRVYWEVFATRRDSSVTTLSTIAGRRVCTIPSTWVATPGHTALQNYLDNGGAYFTSVLPSSGSGGAWVLVDNDPTYNDENGVLTVTHVYHEVFNGLRELAVRVTRDAANLATVEISGVYYATALGTAKANYESGVGLVVSTALSAEGVTRYESHAIPKVTGYDTTGLRYFFSHTYRELAHAQSASGADDTKVTFEKLEVRATRPKQARAITSSITPTPLRFAIATFVAIFDYQLEQDPVSEWASGTSLRAHVLAAVTSRLGDVATVEVVDEEVGALLDGNGLVGTIYMVVTGGSILHYEITQTIVQVPGRDFAPRADGTNFSYKAYRAPPEKQLRREAIVEYVIGSGPSGDPFDDATVSGFGIESTGKTAQASIDDQNASGTLTRPTAGWFIDRRADAPYARTHKPVTRGDGFQTVVMRQIETWRYTGAVT